jgi:hypothetical protein
VRSVEIVMVVALPFYLGLAETAEALVLTVLGPKWVGPVPIVGLLALAMPFMMLLVLYTPACHAQERPGIGVGQRLDRGGRANDRVLGRRILRAARRLAIARVAAYPLYLLLASRQALPVIGARVRVVADAVAPALLAALATAVAIRLLDPTLPPAPRLAILVAGGGLVYLGWLMLFARATLAAVIAALRLR